MVTEELEDFRKSEAIRKGNTQSHMGIRIWRMRMAFPILLLVVADLTRNERLIIIKPKDRKADRV